MFLNNTNLKNFITIVLFFALLFISGIFTSKTPKVIASNIKTITVTFATTPTYATVAKTELKYNKNFALSYSLDDGLDDGYDPAFKYMTGGYSNYIGQYFSGLYYTDGAGNNVPFRAGYAFYTRNSLYNDIHINTPTYLTWTQLQEAVDYGWDVFNHGYTSATVPVDDPEYVYYVGDPGGHATGALDYTYELLRANVDIASHINLKNNAGVTTIPFQTSEVILPNGDEHYNQPAFDNGFKSLYAQDNTYTFDGETITAPKYTPVNSAISSNRLIMPRWFDNEKRYSEIGDYPGQLFGHVDELATMSTGATKYWAQEFTHQVTTSTYAPDWGGGIRWTTWKSLMDHIENTYGRFGDDTIWMAGAQEVHDYMNVKQNTTISQNLVGNQLTIDLDVTNVPTYLRHYALSLLVNSDAQISNITYDAGIISHTDNKTTGLINVDWGVNTYSKNDITRVEGLVSTAETNRSLSAITNARIYVDLLDSATQSSEIAAFNARLDAVVVPLRTWYVNIKGNYISTATLNACLSTSKTYSPSIYNWNDFCVGKNSATTGNDLVNLKDADGLVSTVSLTNTAAFNSNGLASATTGNNSGLYPDAVITSAAHIYATGSTPAKIKIYGLNNLKNYNVKLFGYTSSTGQSGDSAITQYIIGGVTKELIVKLNTTQSVLFTGIVPVNGEIEVTIAAKVASFGYGFLNAMEIVENLLPAPTSFSYNSPNVFTINSAISPLSPTVTGDEITYSVSPSLPAGLSLDTSTGIISGTPTTVVSNGSYTITATNTGGSAIFSISITVNDIPPSNLSYSSPQVYTRGTAITSLSPTVTGVASNYSVSPELPTGLSIDETTGVISGTPTGIAAINPYTVTVSNTGGSTTFNITITVNDIPLSSPTVTPVIGTYNSTQSVTLSATGSDSIRYSTSGLPADCTSGTLYSGAISVSSSQTIYVRACNVVGNSTTASFAYTIDTVPPSSTVATPSAGTYNSTQSVTLSSTGSDYIRYSTSGMPSNCSGGTLYSGAISVSSSQTIYARACDNAGNSSTTSFIYAIDTTPPSTAVATPSGGTYNSTQSVTLSSAGSDYIRYSTSGMPASCSAGTLYATAISVSSALTIYTRACDNAGNSSTTSFSYVIDTDAPATTVANPTAGIYNSSQTVSLSSLGSDYIKYSTTAIPATCSDGTLYSTSITVSESETIYTRACDAIGNSSTTNFAYTIDTVPPSTTVATPTAGTFNSTQSVTLSSTGSDYIRYSTSGIPASCSDGTLYGSAISVSSSQTIYSRACDTAGNSSTTSFAYTIDADAPSTIIASPSAGSYSSTQAVSLSSAGSDYIKYSLTGTPTSCDAGTLYSSAITVSSSSTIYALACDNAGNFTSTNFAYVISTHSNNDDTTPPTIRYSTAETPADCSSGLLYSDTLSFSTSQMIYLRICDNNGNSTTASFYYSAPSRSGGSRVISKSSTSSSASNPSPQSAVNNNPTQVVPVIVTVSDIQKISKNLKFGMVDKDVKTLQIFLITRSKGPNTKSLSLHGITNNFGKLTKAALSEWQKANGLVPDGIFGPKTRAKIKLLNL